MKRLHYCQHVSFEGLGSIATWAEAAGFQISATRFYRNDPLPDVDNLEWLVIMGAPADIGVDVFVPAVTCTGGTKICQEGEPVLR